MKIEKVPFTPYVQKGWLGENEQGYMVSYDELCKALRIPKDHWLGDIEDCDPNILLTLVPKSAITLKDGILHHHEHKPVSTLRSKELVTFRFGIEYDYFDAHIMYRSQGNHYHYVWGTPSALSFQERKHLYVWFTRLDNFFIQKVELPKTRATEW